jgi:hypothetical protein
MISCPLCDAYKEQHTQFVSRAGCSGGIVPRDNDDDAAIRDYPETP